MEFCPDCGAMLLPKDGKLECGCGVGPVTNETCPECGHDKAIYKMLQTRSADEAPTRIFTCTKCKHTWRAYD